MLTVTPGGSAATHSWLASVNSLGLSMKANNGNSKLPVLAVFPCSDWLHTRYIDETFALDWDLYGHVDHFAFPAKNWGVKTQAFLREFAISTSTGTLATGRESENTRQAHTISEMLDGYNLF